MDVFPERIVVDGVEVASVPALAEGADVVVIAELARVLAEKKKLAADLGRDIGPEVQLAIDADTPALVTKSVVRSAANAGFPRVGFLVKRSR